MLFELRLHDHTSGTTPHHRFVTEVVRVLRQVADQVEEGQHSGPAFDAHGNSMGRFSLVFGYDDPAPDREQ